MSENIIKKILKVLELTRRGVDGEKTAAEALLNSLLKKHNLTLSDLESLTKQQRDYKYKSTDHKSIILQIIVMVTSTDEIYSVKNEKIIVVYVTDAEHVQILELIDFHLYNYKVERANILKALKSAYIQKHQLYLKLKR